MINTKEELVVKADEFLTLDYIAIIGVSNDKNKFGNFVFKELKSKGIDIYQIHSKYNNLNGELCYKNINDIPNKVNGIIINVQRNKVIEIIETYRNYGINNFWIQRGSESVLVEEYCSKNNINAIFGKCILMFAKPVSSVHKMHRVIWNIFGKN